MLNLQGVTLVIIETQEHELAALAVRDCLKYVKFKDVLIFTDKPGAFNGHRTLRAENWPNKLGWSQFSWYGVPQHLRTSHALFIQWDAWVWDPAMWRDEYLNYDFVGAPWWYTDGRNVGNGGFSIRSTRLCNYLSDNRVRMPCFTAADDDLLCRKYRPGLEDVGFRWAPESVARNFAFECEKVPHRTFGFHGVFNFPVVLDSEGLEERTKLLRSSPYVKHVAGWNAFAKQCPELINTG